MSNRQILLAELPGAAELEPRHFSARDGERPVPADGELLLRTILISIDPANRAWMNGPSYRPQINAGEVMAGYALAEVVSEPGTVVFADTGWQEWAAVPASEVTPVPIVSDHTHHLSALGLTGLTAYFGLLDIGAPQAGETVVVSAAAGATGNVVGQIARIKGARVVGISGSDEKNAFLRDELGFDATVNHRSSDLRDDLKAACPDGIDVYFDNVGGPLLDLILARTNLRARIVCCGAVSGYDGAAPAEGPRQVPGRVVTHRLRMEGFIVLDHMDRWEAAARELAGWVADGDLKVVEDVVDGLDGAPHALIGLLAGQNVGKRMVRVGPDPG